LGFKSDFLSAHDDASVGALGGRGRRARRWEHISTQDGHSDGYEKKRDWWEEGGDGRERLGAECCF